MVDSRAVADQIAAKLAQLGSAERAAGEKKYLKSDLDFLGASVRDTRKVTAAALKEVAADGPVTHDTVIELATALWASPVFERRLAAVALLEKKHALLDVDDLPLLERLVRESGTWALVDILAVNVTGRLALRCRTRRVLDRWSRDDDFWVRRSSLLAEMRPIKSGEPLAPFASRADRMLEEKEFFIRKAIGWVLREASKTRPDEVVDWIAPRTHRASGVTMREVVKYLDPERRDQLMLAYRERRPAR